MGSKATALTNLVLIAASKLGYRLFKNPRGFDRERKVKYGLGANGSSDLIGYQIFTITPEWVGEKVAVFTAFEIKTENDSERKNQETFINTVIKDGGIAGFIRSVDDLKNH